MSRPVVDHELSYRGRGPAAFIHRRRLELTLRILARLPPEREVRWADYGCSNGFILGLVQERVAGGRPWKFWGFDIDRALLAQAQERGLADTVFEHFDLCAGEVRHRSVFDVVTCFETLEHVSDYRIAFDRLYTACRPGGHIVLAVPNEKGLPGLVKFVGRKVRRRDCYDDFFGPEGGEMAYALRLVTGGSIENYRRPGVSMHSSHLGFDCRRLQSYITREYGTSLRQVLERRTLLNLNVVWLFEKKEIAPSA